MLRAIILATTVTGVVGASGFSVRCSTDRAGYEVSDACAKAARNTSPMAQGKVPRPTADNPGLRPESRQ